MIIETIEKNKLEDELRRNDELWKEDALREGDEYLGLGVLIWHATHPRVCKGANHILGEHGDICVCTVPFYRGWDYELLCKAREELKEIEKRRGWIEHWYKYYVLDAEAEDWEREKALLDIEDEEEGIQKAYKNLFDYLQGALLEAEPKWRLRYDAKDMGARYAPEVYAALYTQEEGLHDIERIENHKPVPLPKGEVYIKDTEQNRAVILAAAARVCEKNGWDFKPDDEVGFRLVKQGGAWVIKMFWEFQRLRWGLAWRRRIEEGYKFYYKLRQHLIHRWHWGWLECSEPHRRPVCLWVRKKEKSGWLFPDGSYRVLGGCNPKPKNIQTFMV